MILYFKTPTHIYTDKQHFDTKQASMIVQEKEPLSPHETMGVSQDRLAPFILW